MASHTTDPPVPFGATAAAKWAELIDTREWRGGQLAALAAYCAAHGRWVDAETWLNDPDHGPVVTIRDDKGNVRSHGPAPQLAIAERSAKEVVRLAKLLRL